MPNLSPKTTTQTREINKFRLTLQTIVDCFDARAELFTSDADMAANFVDRARLVLGMPARVESVVAGVTRADTGQQSFVSTTVDNAPTEVRFSNPPINMILHCPSCHKQHVDAPDGDWTNPPHKSHLCHHCSTVWRPADVATNGVAYIQSTGTRDTWICVDPDDPMARDLSSNPDTGHFSAEASFGGLMGRTHGTERPEWTAALMHLFMTMACCWRDEQTEPDIEAARWQLWDAAFDRSGRPHTIPTPPSPIWPPADCYAISRQCIPAVQAACAIAGECRRQECENFGKERRDD